MSERDEFSGDECVFLPRDDLNSVEAVADINADQLAAAANNFDIGQLSPRRRFFRGALQVTAIWALSGIWTVCT